MIKDKQSDASSLVTPAMSRSLKKEQANNEIKNDGLNSALEQSAIDTLNNIFNESRGFKDPENPDTQFDLRNYGCSILKNLSTNELEMAAHNPNRYEEGQDLTDDYVNTDIQNIEIYEKTPKVCLPKIKANFRLSKDGVEAEGEYIKSINSLSKPKPISIDLNIEKERNNSVMNMQNRIVTSKVLTQKFPSNLTRKSSFKDNNNIDRKIILTKDKGKNVHDLERQEIEKIFQKKKSQLYNRQNPSLSKNNVIDVNQIFGINEFTTINALTPNEMIQGIKKNLNAHKVNSSTRVNSNIIYKSNTQNLQQEIIKNSSPLRKVNTNEYSNELSDKFKHQNSRRNSKMNKMTKRESVCKPNANETLESLLDNSNYLPLMPKYEGIERFPNSKNIILNLNSSTAAKNTDTDNVKYKELSMSIQALKNRKLFLMKNAEKIKQLSVTMQNYIECRERSHRASKSQLNVILKQDITPQKQVPKTRHRRAEISVNRALKDNLSILKEIEIQLGVS